MSSVHVPRPPGGDGGMGGRPEYGGRRQHSPITSSRGGRTARSTASKPSSAADQVEYMQTQCDLFTRRIEVEKRRAAELDKKLKVSRTATCLPFSLLLCCATLLYARVEPAHERVALRTSFNACSVSLALSILRFPK